MHYKHFQSQFINNLSDPLSIRIIFEYLPDISFFVKDCHGRIVTVSSSVLKRLGMSHESEFVGRTDAEFYPREMSDAYIRDDRRVFETGKPVLNRLEVWLNERGHADWSVTSKVPLFGKNGKVIGLMGVSRRDLHPSVTETSSEATKAVDYLRNNIRHVDSIAELATGAVSTRTLNRRITQELGISPYELILRIRVQAAAEALLKTEASISQIALDLGFCDQSHFTQQFRKRMGVTPRQFRVSRQTGVECQ